MLSNDDIERILDVAYEFNIKVNEDEVSDMWEDYTRRNGRDVTLPLNRGELAKMLQEAVMCVG